MAETIATISARLRIEYPKPQYDWDQNGPHEMSDARYDQWILDQATYIRDQQLATEADAARRAEIQAKIDRLNPILTKLQNNVNLTGAENRTLLMDVLLYLIPKMIDEAKAQLGGTGD